jgi:hypothetical protein
MRWIFAKGYESLFRKYKKRFIGVSTWLGVNVNVVGLSCCHPSEKEEKYKLSLPKEQLAIAITNRL